MDGAADMNGVGTLMADRPPRRQHGPAMLLALCVVTLLATVFGAEVMVVVNMRHCAIRTTQAGLSNMTVVLAEQMNRSFNALDRVLLNLTDTIRSSGVTDGESFARILGTEAFRTRLSEKLTGMPFAEAVLLVDARGRLVNASSSWPLPEESAAARNYFAAMARDTGPARAFGTLARNPATGNQTLLLARHVAGRDGIYLGLVVGAVSLPYFEDFLRSVSESQDRTVTLFRPDGMVLASYPPGRDIGSVDPALTALITDSDPEAGGQIRAWRELQDFPLIVGTTQPAEAALRDWLDVVWLVGLISVGSLCWVVSVAVALGRWWSRQQVLNRERTERAELEQARLAAEAELARARERHAEEASRAKSGFLATMSHEIRTPMNGVLGLAASLLDEPLAPEHRRVVEAIRDSGDSLLRILNDILDFSKLDAGRMTFEDVAFSPVTLTHGIVSILGPRARAKGLSISVTCDAGIPAALLGDAGRIRQVLLNLVSNAVKFTETGGIDIVTRLIGRGEDTATLEWIVRDTGIGIPADRIDALFKEFIQADSSISRRFGGSGMGLAISKRLIEQMGGAVSVQSEPGAGTTFRVRLILPVVDKVETDDVFGFDITGTFVSHLATMGRALRVLFAEDNPTNQFVALQILKGFNVQVDVVSDGLEAIDAATTFLYDVICMDMQMPEMDGLSATRLLRQRGGRLADIPVIALTANAFPEDVKACLDAGMNLFVAKPVRKEALLAAILSALGAAMPAVPQEHQAGAAGRRDRSLQGPRAVAGQTPDEAVMDEAALAELVVAIGETGVQEMLDVFESETLARLNRLADPARERAADDRELHTLKGAAGAVCARRLAALSQSIEARLREGGLLATEDVALLRKAFDAWRQATRDRRQEVARAA